MYHVIGTGLTTILLYSISYIFYRIGYFSLVFHRKIWNIILAIAFFTTAIAGLFLALQTNYKWDIPVVKTIVRLHAEFGIGMAFTGIIHFLWHLPYFKKVVKSQNNIIQEQSFSPALSSAAMSTNLFITGLVSSSIQLLFLREIMNISGGYELIAGIFLGSWLISSSIGAYLAGKSSFADIRKINLIFSVSPLISLLLLLLLSRLFLNTGESPSLLLSIIYTFLVLIPYCLVSGFTFIKLISFARSGNGYIPGKSFSIETTGGIISGVLISILTSGILNTYQLLLLTILFSLSYVLLTFYILSRRAIIVSRLIILSLAVSIIILNPDIIFRQILLPGIIVSGNQDTPYGNIVEGSYMNEKSTFYNQRIIKYSDDIIEREEDIHYAMLQRPSPESVILISGSLASLMPEIQKYPVNKIIYIERDPALIMSQKKSADGYSGELIIESDDALKYIRQSDEQVDAVILLIPPPSTLLLNRFYTTEFFTIVRNRLHDDGVFICSPGPGDTYFNKESIDLFSSINNSLKAVFKYVTPVAGNKLYFIASDKELSVAFCELSGLRKITNIYVGPDYLSDDLIAKKSEDVRSLLNSDKRQNKLAFPIASFHFQSYNFSKNIDEKILAIGLIIFAFALPVLTIKGKNILMYFSASALAGFEIIILLSIQLIFGNIYHLTGAIIAVLMTGLAIGAATEIKLLVRLPVRIKGFILLVIYLLYGLFYNKIGSAGSGIPAILIIGLSSFLPALITGHIFRELTIEAEGSLVTSAVYSADLAGSALGFIFIAALSVPLLGIKVSVFLIAALIFTGIVFGTIRNL